MQHRYFGDVGDYGKYGLLRALCGSNEVPRLRLGIIWYLFPDEGHNKDGKHVSYLRKKSYRECDPPLYDFLRSEILDDAGAIKPDSRNLTSVSKSGIFPSDTLYFERALEYLRTESPDLRLAKRSAWVTASQEEIKEADIVFLDPDNGIECASRARGHDKGPKYVFWDDIDALVLRNKSVIIYHHLGRNGGTHPEQARKLLQVMAAKYHRTSPMSIIFRRGSSRAYFIIPSQTNEDVLRDRFERFAQGPWRPHFTSFQIPPKRILTG